MEESQFDVIILGTGLVNSITAAALAKRGYKVAHIDSNAYYGGDDASLSLEELVKWADAAVAAGPSSRFQRVARSAEVPPHARTYSICLQPAVIPSVGPLISALVASGVAKYSGFRLLEAVSVYDGTGVKAVPGSKEDIFKSKEISLIEKRRLMRFLTFAASEFEGKKELEGLEDSPFLEFLPKVFSLSKEITSIIGYSLAFCMSSSEPTLPTLRRLRNYLRSGGRYGASPFLIGEYGGIGDIAQGFCRAAAVGGGVYILSRKLLCIARVPPAETPISETPDAAADVDPAPSPSPVDFKYTLDLEDFPDTLSCRMIISSPEYVPPELQSDIHQIPSTSEGVNNIAALARCILIIDQPLVLRPSPPPAEPELATDESGVAPEPQDESASAIPAAQERPFDAAVVVFPPSTVEGGSQTHPATVLINGEASLATPKGKWLVYITLPIDTLPNDATSAESLLRPYVNALLRLSAGPSALAPLFTLSYLETPRTVPPGAPRDAQQGPPTCLVPAPVPTASLPDFADQATAIAEATFRAAVAALGSSAARAVEDDAADREEEEDEGPVRFWPPLPADDDDNDNEW